MKTWRKTSQERVTPRSRPWRRAGCSVALLYTLCLMRPGDAYASFQLSNPSARSAAMANASVAHSPEPAAVFSNPAGLTFLSDPALSLTYASLFAGVADARLFQGNAAWSLPMGPGVAGLGFAMFQADSLKSEETVALSYAVGLPGGSLGATAKHLKNAYDTSGDPRAAADPVFQSGTAQRALSLDVGLQLSLARVMSLGVSARNLNRPDVGLGGSERLRREVQSGLGLDLQGLGLKVSGALLYAASKDGLARGVSAPMFGLEKTLAGESLALRCGAARNRLAAGFGVQLKPLRIDYAMSLANVSGNNDVSDHRVGLTYQFRRTGERP